MSIKEMQQLDEDVLKAANRAGEERRQQELAQEDEARSRKAEMDALLEAETKKRNAEKKAVACKQQRFLKMVVRLMACLLAAVVFLALMLDPLWVPVVGCLGIMVFVIMAAINLDRYLRSGK